MNPTQRTSDDQAQLKPWIDLLEQLSQGAVNLTVGLAAGSRLPNERGALDRLAQAGLSVEDGRRCLLIRLSLGGQVVPKRQLRSARASEQPPTAIPSPIGNWFDVTIPMQTGTTVARTLERLPRWLAAWKNEYARILIDLGPLDQPLCRTIGRYCDSCLLLLGPETCASPTWLRRHIDQLTQCDVTMAGSIIVSAEPVPVAV